MSSGVPLYVLLNPEGKLMLLPFIYIGFRAYEAKQSILTLLKSDFNLFVLTTDIFENLQHPYADTNTVWFLHLKIVLVVCSFQCK